MPNFRNVYFAFHYDDVFLVNQVRKCGIFAERKSFGDWAEHETVQNNSKSAIEDWIKEQMVGASVTVVLIGAETATRPYVRFEIEESIREKKGLLGIYIDQLTGGNQRHFYTRLRGANPFARLPAREVQAKREAIATGLLASGGATPRLFPPGLLESGDVPRLFPPPPATRNTLATILSRGAPTPAPQQNSLAELLRYGMFATPPKTTLLSPPPQVLTLAQQVECFCWKADNGIVNFDKWVEDAARAVGR